MRKSTGCLFALLILVLLQGFMALHSLQSVRREAPVLRETASLVKSLELTDLCLFTEARYTRHPSQADRHAAFQDHPLSMEHFPSGSLLVPPAALKETHAYVD
jgi:hypothetical protein